MRHREYPESTEAAAPVAAPTQCPECRSPDVKTTSKMVTANSYWRCEACGEVWNVERLKAGSRYADFRPFRR